MAILHLNFHYLLNSYVILLGGMHKKWVFNQF